MSFQSGVVYFDGRDIAPDEVSAVRALVPAGAEEYRQPGIFFAHSPAPSGDSRRPAAITFDGRLDNRDELLLRWHGKLAADQSDRALALAAYQARGCDGLADVVGDWSLALWDADRKTTVLASDYAGVRPLYYCVQPERALWSTRLDPLVHLTRAYEMDDEYAAGFLAFGGCPGRTPYRGIQSVQSGHAVEITAQGALSRPFWTLPLHDTIRCSSAAEYEERLRFLFREALRCRIPDGARCLSELSGGLDSSTIVTMAARMIETGELRPARFSTITVEHEGSRDAPFYSAVERACGLESVHVSADDYPFLTPAETGGAFPAFWQPLLQKMAETARQLGAATYITGKFGDDIMGNWWDAGDRVAGAVRDAGLRAGLRQALDWSQTMRVPIGWILWKALHTSLPAPLLGDVSPVVSSAVAPSETLEDSIAPELRKRTAISDPRTFFPRDWVYARPGRRQLLRSLMRSLAMRRLQVPEPLEHLDYVQPYAHRPLVVFMLSIPPDIACGPGEPRRLMRRAFRDLWPRELRSRRSKDGFGGVFLDSLRPLALGLLQSREPLQVVQYGYIDSRSLEKRLERLALSLSCNQSQLRQIILLELWLRGRAARPKVQSVSVTA